MKPIIPVFVLALLISGCTSLVDKGDKLFESGDFQAAAQFYERALKRDPNNVEATLGLNRAREKIIDHGLIEVRMLRLSSNAEGAAQKLEQILRNQQAWNLNFSGAIAATQKEETHFARGWLAKEASRLGEGQYPDQYRFFEAQYSYLIGSSVQLKNELAGMNSRVQKKGEKMCKQLAKNVSGQRFFLKEFTNKYCVMWQTPAILKVNEIDKTRFSSLQLNNRIGIYSNIGNDLNSIVDNRVQNISEVFRRSVWYNEKGDQPLRVNASGRVDYSRHSRRVERFADYTVKHTSKTRNAAGEEIVTTDKEDKIHRYIAELYTEELSMNVSLQTAIERESLVRDVSFQKNYQTESHNESFSLANLWPQSPVFVDLAAIVDSEFSGLQNAFLSALDQRWENTFCGNTLGQEHGENILRCAAINPEHAYVNNWFFNKFGVSYQNMAVLAGLE